MAIEQSINKVLNQVDFKSRRSGNGSGSGKGSFARSYITCHKCGKKGHIQKDCRSKGNGSSGNSSKKSTNKLPEWVTRKPVVRSLVSETTGFIVAHSGSSFVDFLGEFPLEPFTFDLQSFWMCPFLPHL